MNLYLKSRQKSKGQAMIEYLILVGLVLMLTLRIAGAFKTFLGDMMGIFNDTLSTHLTVGVCKNFCFFSNYKNGREN